jgi:phosphatidylglycerol lysyltransferase
VTAHPHSTWHKVTALVGVVLFIVASWVLVREITHLGAGALIHALASVPRSVLGMVIGLVAVNYFVLTLHDQLAFVYAGIRLSRFKIFLASFVGYAVSNNLGFAMLSGGSARYRFHGRWGVHPADLSRVVLFFATAFWVGISLIGGLCLLLAPPPGLAEIAPRPLVIAAGVLLLVLLAAYGVLCAMQVGPLRIREFAIPLPKPQLLLAQLVVCTVDWLLAAQTIHALLPDPRPDFAVVLGAYVAAQVVGVVSHVPGSLGVFEGLMVLLLDDPMPSIIPALFVFRIVYYLLPLAVAIVVLLVDGVLHQRRSRTARTI